MQLRQPPGGARGSKAAASSGSASQAAEDQQPTHKDGASALHALASFLEALNNRDADGRIIIEPPGPSGTSGSTSGAGGGAACSSGAGGQDGTPASRHGALRYVLLNAASHVTPVLAQARSVVLVSGTLAPVSALQAQLFPSLPPERLRHFECGHVIPARQLLALPVARAPGGQLLDLRHDARGTATMLDAVGQLLLSLAGVVPGGLVAFVTSFAYLDQLLARWQATGMAAKLQAVKPLFKWVVLVGVCLQLCMPGARLQQLCTRWLVWLQASGGIVLVVRWVPCLLPTTGCIASEIAGV